MNQSLRVGKPTNTIHSAVPPAARPDQSLQSAASAAVSEFAQRWDRELGKLATKVDCQCDPPQEGTEETDHSPDCPVGSLRQAGRLMCEEASNLFWKSQED